MSQPSALENLLQAYPALWDGKGLGDSARSTVSTGFADLDALLPGGGWPLGATVELRIAADGIGELRLLMPVMRRLTDAGQRIAWVAPPYVPYAPALAAAGLEPSTLTVLQPPAQRDIAWSMEKLLQSPDCGMVLGWPPRMTLTGGRRLQLAAESGNSIGFSLCRNAPEVPGQRTAASLCLRLWRRDSAGPLCLRILKMRGACHRRELVLVL